MEDKELITPNDNIEKATEGQATLDNQALEQDKTENSSENVNKEDENSSTEQENSQENAVLYDDEKSYREFVDSLPAKWYVLHTFSGYENVAKENLETVIEKFNLQDRIFDIIIPMEDVVEEKNGKKKLVQRKSMPCYILVKMKYADDIWHNVIRTRGITGFVGPKGRPLPMTDEEVMKLRLEKIKVDVDLEPGDKVEIIDGALNGQFGVVTAIDKESGIVSVNVEMFNRETPVDVGLAQLRKLNS